MSSLRLPPPWRHRLGWVLGLLLGAVLALLTATAPVEAELGREYDLWSRSLPAPPQSLPIVVVAIDDASIQAAGQRWPWPRRLHARLIDSLLDQGVALIAFDVLFDQPSNEADDAAFEAAIRRAGGKVVLASKIVTEDTPAGRIWRRVDPLPRFLAAGAETALVQVAIDRDDVVRRQPDSKGALWRVLAQRLERLVDEVAADLTTGPDRYIRYFGPAGSFDYLPVQQALDASRHVAPGALSGSLVMVGRTGVAAIDVGVAEPDLFKTPYSALDGNRTPGVEVHATLVANAVGHHLVERTSAWLSALLLIVCVTLLVGLAGGRGLRRQALVVSWLSLGLVGLGYGLFRWQQVWLPVLPTLLSLGLVQLGQGYLVYRRERRARLEIRRMLALYLPERLVHELERHPERLALGGSQRELTVMFTDLAGFASLAEGMDPAEVAEALNHYFAAMHQQVFACEGTLDKFIGDAIMAFWGAPLADPLQADRALACACAMQAAMPAINARLAEHGWPALTMRIGLHSGHAVVGNLGSPMRFSYTALGDDVNLAARLEGANKFYGTVILLSGETVTRLSRRDGLRRVDRVRVKGRAQTTDLYTPCPDPLLIAATEAAWQAYAAGNWEEAERLWQDILMRWPDDALAPRYLDRIEGFMVVPPMDDWAGEWVLTEK
ncbi:CHASE2 domain-containing protein [Chitinimonas lacunae]|uniref:CHASE2 domain-containing protein n=1 Tax=Chitinimonas lacunae TaxID=1963018 RepID=A0ABV8MX18_9NEIS